MASSEAGTSTLQGRRLIESSLGNGTAVKSLTPKRRVHAFSNSAISCGEYLITLVAPAIKLSSTFLSSAVHFRYLRDLPMRLGSTYGQSCLSVRKGAMR